MAEVKMDMTEYELLKENKKLLEDALKKERELQVQIEKLTKEKIEALEASKYRVTKIIKTENIDRVYIKRNVEESINAFHRIIRSTLNSNSVRTSAFEFTYNELIDAIFVKKSVGSNPIIEVTTHGFDDIKAEIREELKNNRDEKDKEKLDHADIVIKESESLRKENTILQTEKNSLVNINRELVVTNDVLTKEYNIIENNNNKILEIKKLLNRSNINIFNIFGILNKITTILR